MSLNISSKELGIIEQELIQLLNAVLKKVLGKGSAWMDLYLVGDMVLVTATGILSNQEIMIMEGTTEASHIIKEYKGKALEAGQDYIKRKIVESYPQIEISDIYFDINLRKDRAMIIFTFDNGDNKLKE